MKLFEKEVRSYNILSKSICNVDFNGCKGVLVNP